MDMIQIEFERQRLRSFVAGAIRWAFPTVRLDGEIINFTMIWRQCKQIFKLYYTLLVVLLLQSQSRTI